MRSREGSEKLQNQLHCSQQSDRAAVRKSYNNLRI